MTFDIPGYIAKNIYDHIMTSRLLWFAGINPHKWVALSLYCFPEMFEWG